MATRNISLTAHQDAFITKLVAKGEYQNASEAMRDALRALQQRRREDALRLAALRTQIEVGIRDLDEGNFDEIDQRDLKKYLGRLAAPPSARRRSR